jgi:RNA polymerase sigma-70 factor (ECF subfamily)
MYREVLVLRDVEGLTAPEVAEVMGLSVEAVKSRLHRARVAVREAVAPLLGIPGTGAVPAPPTAATPATASTAERCPDIVELFSKHLEGEISATLCADMERHLARCPACDARCQSLQKTLALCKAAPLPEVPAPVQASIRQALKDLVSVRS